MPRERKRYSKRFKREAIRLYELGERPAHEVEMELGISSGLLCKWKMEFKRLNQNVGTAQVNNNPADAEARIRQLELEISALREDKEVLRRALEVFSRLTDGFLPQRLPSASHDQWAEVHLKDNQNHWLFYPEKEMSGR